MAKHIKFEVSSGNKTYATEENAIKAAQKMYGDNIELRFIVAKAENGRFIPVFIGESALRAGVHFNFYTVA